MRARDFITEDLEHDQDLRSMLSDVREEMENIDDTSIRIKETDPRWAGLEKDYNALLAVEHVIKNHIKALRSNVMDNNIFMYDYNGDPGEIAAIHVLLQGTLAQVIWLGSYNSQGGSLYRSAMQEAQRRGAQRVEVNAKWNSDGFYRKMGLSNTGTSGEYNPFTGSQLNKMSGDLEENFYES
jgi:hypothetical protein